MQKSKNFAAKFYKNSIFKFAPKRWSKVIFKILAGIHVTGGMFKSNRTTSMPKSVPRLVVDKVKLMHLTMSKASLIALSLVVNFPNHL